MRVLRLKWNKLVKIDDRGCKQGSTLIIGMTMEQQMCVRCLKTLRDEFVLLCSLIISQKISKSEIFSLMISNSFSCLYTSLLLCFYKFWDELNNIGKLEAVRLIAFVYDRRIIPVAQFKRHQKEGEGTQKNEENCARSTWTKSKSWR